MIKRITGLLAGALLMTTAQAQDNDVQVVEWQSPDCSQYSSFKRCRNAVKTNYRKQRQQEMKSQGLSFWYYERPGFKGDAQQAVKDKLEGMALFHFDVEKDGTTSNVRLSQVSSEDAKVYSIPLIEAISKWTFIPVENKVENVEWKIEVFFEAEECKDQPEDGVEKKDCYQS